MCFLITIFAFFCQKTSVPSIYVKTVTLDKLQKLYWISNDAESGFLSYLFETFCFLRIHVFCKASTELAKKNTVLVSEIFIVFFFVCQMTVTQKWTMEFDKKNSGFNILTKYNFSTKNHSCCDVLGSNHYFR